MQCSRCGTPSAPGRARPRPAIVAGLYALGLVLSWSLTGSLLHDTVEGLQRSALPLWRVWLPALFLLGAVAAQFARPRREVCPRCGFTHPAWLLVGSIRESSTATAEGPTRRRALRATCAALAATVAGGLAALLRNRDWIPVARNIAWTDVEKTSPHPRPEWHDARIRSQRRLGRTNVMVSDISLGSARINDADVARHALDSGITYIDTAPDYADTESERVLGEAMKGRRDQVFLATKFCRADGHLPDDTPVPKIIEAVEGSLRRLQTDHVDLIHVHSCDRVERLMAPNIHEAFDRLKEQGKVRFLGVSTHTPNLVQVANAAIDSRRFDVLMLAYHYGLWPEFSDLLQKARDHDVGVVAMKTLKGAKHTDLKGFEDGAAAYSQAAFRWVLSNPAVSCLVISISTHEQVEEYVAASGTALTAQDTALLRRYDQLVAGDYCRPHCGECLASCPHELPVNDVLRYRMYAKDYHWPSEGGRLYAGLKRNAAACSSCPAPCAGTCPIDVPIREKMMDAHRVLSRVA